MNYSDQFLLSRTVTYSLRGQTANEIMKKEDKKKKDKEDLFNKAN